MDKKKTYPIGTKIKYIGYCKACKDKVGKVVGISEQTCWVVLPQSTCSAARGGRKVMCNWSDIIPIIVKNQQLLFSFMD